MARSFVSYTGDGATTDFAVPFDYLSRDHVSVTVAGVSQTFTFLNDGTIQLSTAPANGALVRIARSTSPDTRVVDFQNSAILTEETLDQSATQTFYLVQEAIDTADASIRVVLGAWDAQGIPITNLPDPVNDTDALTLAWFNTNFTTVAAEITAAQAAATAADADATAAAASATAAFQSEQNAAASAASLNANNLLAKDQNLSGLTDPEQAKLNLDIVIANRAEAEGGTNNTKFMTPARVAQAIAAQSDSFSYEEFTTSGTWTKPAGVTFVYVEAIGGGGSGGKLTSISNAGGGGGGGFAARLLLASDVGASETVTIGAGGLRLSAQGTGNDGGDTTFGAHLTGRGGKGGTGPSSLFRGDGGGGEPGAINTFGGFAVGGYSSGGGGCGAGSVNGANCVMGGAGGAGIQSGGVGSGGASVQGGNGGNSNVNANAQDGFAPGGGGGANCGTGNSGGGGDGRVRVWAW